MANPPVPPITWVGRDAVGNLVDITADTDELTMPITVSGGGGGSLTVDNQSDPPAEVTSLVAVGATISGDEATLGGRFYAQDTDPGAVGAGAVWKDTTLSGSSTKWWERNADNDGWDAAAVRRTVSSGDNVSNAGTYASAVGAGIADARIFATASGDGPANASAHANTDGDGEADASAVAIAGGSGDAYGLTYAQTVDGTADATATASASGDGDATVLSAATAAGTGTATAGTTATHGAATAGINVEADSTSARMSFNDAAPIAKPTGVAVTAEGIHAALVSLGLIEA